MEWRCLWSAGALRCGGEVEALLPEKCGLVDMAHRSLARNGAAGKSRARGQRAAQRDMTSARQQPPATSHLTTTLDDLTSRATISV